MTVFEIMLLTAVIAAFGCHLASVSIASGRCVRQKKSFVLDVAPLVSIIRPVSGLENYIETTLASTFTLDYPNYEIIFCFTSANDSALRVVQRLIEKYPEKPARILIGNEHIGDNPKLNNCVKGWRAAVSDWIVVADSNVLMPPYYLSCLLHSWETDTGVVSSPPIGSHPHNFWAQVECAFLNGYQARWQYTADAIGWGFAHGKNMLFRREILTAAGGLAVLNRERSEDAASTKIMRGMGLRVRLVDVPFSQPIGYRRLSEVWLRQVRWARIRRSAFPVIFALEILTGVTLPLALGVWLASALGAPMVTSAIGLSIVWYGSEMFLVRIAGWPLPISYPIYALVRDFLLPVLWFEAWRERSSVWRGTVIHFGDVAASEKIK